MTTWSFNDWGVRDALVDAAKRGTRSRSSPRIGQPEGALQALGSLRQRSTRQLEDGRSVDKAQQHRAAVQGACRGSGGTPHSKYFLFNDVGSPHQRNIVMQTSMNLTQFAFQGPVEPGDRVEVQAVFNHYLAVFDQSSGQQVAGRQCLRARRRSETSIDIFFPRPAPRLADPVMRRLNQVSCTGAASAGVKRPHPDPDHPVRHLRHRGVWIAKKLRSLWNAGCDVAHHLLGHQPPGDQDPAQPLGPRPDPDEAVGHQERQGRDREVQPQQVDRRSPATTAPARAYVDGARRLRQLERPRLPQRRADAAVVRATPRPSATSTTSTRPGARAPRSAPRFGRMATGTGTLAPQEAAARRRLPRTCRSSPRSARASTSTCPRTAEPSGAYADAHEGVTTNCCGDAPCVVCRLLRF